jgi:flagellar hook-associated protein 3 FlgL
MDTIRRNPLFVAHQTTSRIQSLVAKMSRAQLVAITQIKVNSPSDAPGRWSEIHGLQAAAADHEIWGANLDRAQGWIDAAESTLAEASTVMQQAIERAVQLSSFMYNGGQREEAATEVAELHKTLVGLANTRVGGRALFAGDAFDGDAFDASGNYVGGPATGRAQVGPDDHLSVSLDGSEFFQGDVDVFAALTALQTALANNDPDAVAGTLQTLQDAHNQLVLGRQEVGYRQNHISDAREASENLSLMLEEQLHAVVAADPAESYSELMSLQTSYQAALQVVASSSGARLFDFLR